LVDAFRIQAKSFRRGIILQQGFESGLRGDHAALHGEVNAFEARGIDEASGVAGNHEAVARESGERPPSAVGQGLRAIADHAPALEQFGDEGVTLESGALDAGRGAVPIVESGLRTPARQCCFGLRRCLRHHTPW